MTPAPRLFTLLAIFAIGSCFGQTADTTLVRSLHEKASKFWSSYPDSLLYYRDSAWHVAVRINDQVGIAKSYTDLGIYHWVKGDYAKAIQAYDTSNYILDKAERPAEKISNLSNLGMTYSKLGNFPKAINYLLESLRLLEQFKRKDAQAKVYNSLGVAYKNYGNLTNATDAYQKALALFKELKAPELVAGCYTNLGNIYKINKNNDKAIEFQLKALVIFDSLKNPRGILSCYNNISDIHLESGNYTEALTFSDKALSFSREKGFLASEITALFISGSVQLKLKNYPLAQQHFLQGIALAEKKSNRVDLVKLYNGLSICYKAMGRTAEALTFYEKYSVLKDSLFNQESLTTVSNLQTSYDLERKEASIRLLQKDNEIKTLSRNRTVLAAVALLLVAGLIVARQRMKINKDQQLKEQEKKLHDIENALLQSELKISRVKEGDLMDEVAYKNKSLTTYALSMVQKNEILAEIKESVERILREPGDHAEQLKKLGKVVDYSLTIEKDWDEFKLYFEDVHNDFFVKLRERFPELGGADLKLCALIRLNLNVKQSAAILRIAPESVKIARHRLRKKFNMQTEDNLNGFIMSL